MNICLQHVLARREKSALKLKEVWHEQTDHELVRHLVGNPARGSVYARRAMVMYEVEVMLFVAPKLKQLLVGTA